MTDYSQMTDDELRAEYARQKQGVAKPVASQAAPSTANKYASMSNEELQAEYESQKAMAADKQQNPGFAGKIARKLRSWAAPKLSDKAPMAPAHAAMVDGVGDFALNFAADTIADPLKTMVIDPAKAAKNAPGNFIQGKMDEVGAVGSFLKGDMQGAKDKTMSAFGNNLEAGAGMMGAAGFFPAAKGAAAITSNAAKGIGHHISRGAPRIGAHGATPQSAIPFDVRKEIERMAKAEGISQDELAARLSNLAVDGSPDELLFQGVGMPQAGQALGNRAGESRSIMKEAVTAQQRGQSGRVEGAFRTALDDPDFKTTADAIEERMKTIGSPLYEKAFAAGVNPTPSLQTALNIPIMESYVKRGAEKLVKLGHDDPLNNARILHEAKRLIDDDIGASVRGGRGQEASDLIKLKNKVLKGMDESIDGYGDARKVWADESSSSKDAMEFGLSVFKGDADDFISELAKMSDDKLEFTRAGVMKAIQRQLDTPEEYSALKLAFRKPSFRQKLDAILPQGATDDLFKRLTREGELAEMGQGANPIKNSKTANVQESITMLDSALSGPTRRGAGSVAGYVAQNGINPTAAIKMAGAKAANILPKRPEELYTEVARIMAMPAKEGAAYLATLPPAERQAVTTMMQKIKGAGKHISTQAPRMTTPIVAGAAVNQGN